MYYLLGCALLSVKSENYKSCSDEAIIQILNRCKRKLKINKKITLLIDKKNKSPMIFGILNTRIVIPKNIAKEANYENIKYIILHELLHYKKYDLTINWVINILNAVYWFNPIIIYSLKQMKNDCESKTDEYVIENLKKQEQINYGRSILYMVENLLENTNVIGSNTILGGKSQMRKRINNIVNFKKPAVISTAIAIIISITIGAFCFTNSFASNIPLISLENTSSNTTNIVNTTNMDNITDVVNTTNMNNIADAANTTERLIYADNVGSYAPYELIVFLNRFQPDLPRKDDYSKDSMLRKMYNVGAYIASASGEYEINASDGYNLEAKYKFKVSDDMKSLNYCEQYQRDNYNSLSFIDISAIDGSYHVDRNSKTYTDYKYNPLPINLSDYYLINPKDITSIIYSNSGQIQGVFPPIAAPYGQILSPSEIYVGLLAVDSDWDIVSKDEYLGFECAVIEGSLNYEKYVERLFKTKDFKLWVDSASGALLKYELYDESGNLSATLNTKRLEINKVISDNEFTIDNIDLTGYSRITKDDEDEVLPRNDGLSEEQVAFQNNVNNFIEQRISDSPYGHIIETAAGSLEGEEATQFTIMISKRRGEYTTEIRNLVEEIKDFVIQNKGNVEITNILFVVLNDLNSSETTTYEYIVSDEEYGSMWVTDESKDKELSEEQIYLIQSVDNFILEKIYEVKYANVIRDGASALDGENFEQFNVLIIKNGNPSEAELKELVEEIKDFILQNMGNVKVSNILFTAGDMHSLSEENTFEYIISKEGYEPGWLTNN